MPALIAAHRFLAAALSFALWAEEEKYLAEKRAKVAAQIIESAAEYFAMRSTGADIIVPIFDDKEIMEAKAA